MGRSWPREKIPLAAAFGVDMPFWILRPAGWLLPAQERNSCRVSREGEARNAASGRGRWQRTVVVVCDAMPWIRAMEVVFQGEIVHSLNQMNACQQERHEGRATPHELVARAAHALVQVDGREGFHRTG